jgi:HD-GYP domain-containing protein (c-di-GMP phosphodiesterase class II)
MSDPMRPTSDGMAALGDKGMREAGRSFLFGIYAILRNLRLYPLDNATVQKSLQEFTGFTRQLVAEEGECAFRVQGEYLFLNATRMKLDLDNFTSFSFMLTRMRDVNIGTMRMTTAPAAEQWTVLLTFLVDPPDGTRMERLQMLEARLGESQVEVFDLRPLEETPEDTVEADGSKERAKRVYEQSVGASKEVMTALRLGQGANIKKVKRVVQGIVDQILTDEASLVGLTTIRDYDDYTFTHCVNVCIFAIALGRRLGLTRVQLYDLGIAGLFHDIGKSRVPIEIIQKPDLLTEDEWRLVSSHPWLGVLVLFNLKDQTELPYRTMLVTYQHHMKRDLTGYPRSPRMSDMTFYSKIVAVADSFDAATSRRVYMDSAKHPAAVLREMRDDPRRGMDPVVVKAFVSLLGVYPVGTCVVLDTMELGIVERVNPVPEMGARPIVRIISDRTGRVQFPGKSHDLADRGPDGRFARSIIKVVEAERFGIRVSDYFI